MQRPPFFVVDRFDLHGRVGPPPVRAARGAPEEVLRRIVLLRRAFDGRRRIRVVVVVRRPVALGLGRRPGLARPRGRRFIVALLPVEQRLERAFELRRVARVARARGRDRRAHLSLELRHGAVCRARRPSTATPPFTAPQVQPFSCCEPLRRCDAHAIAPQRSHPSRARGSKRCLTLDAAAIRTAFKTVVPRPRQVLSALYHPPDASPFAIRS